MESKKMKRFLVIITITLTLLGTANATTVYQRLGNTTFDNQGNSWTTVGDTTFGW